MRKSVWFWVLMAAIAIPEYFWIQWDYNALLSVITGILTGVIFIGFALEILGRRK
jgi:hypothetical protein